MVFAQELPKIEVVGFEEKPFDTSARDERYKIIDGNGELFSIIKLQSNNQDDNLNAYEFDFGLCESRIKTVNGEVWIYVQRNAMYVTIKREGYKVLKHELNTTVQSGRVYEMTLSGEAQMIYKQMVHFKVSPTNSNATIMYTDNSNPDAVEEKFGDVDSNGELARVLPLGSYKYRVVSTKYYPCEGILTLDDINNNFVENVILRPKFALMTLAVDEGVEIFIDGNSVGVGGWSGELNSGTYNIECRKVGYKPNTEVLKVLEGRNDTIMLQSLTPIFGSLSLNSSPLGARITIDGKDYGYTPKIVNELIVGSHQVKISKDGFNSETSTVVIKEKEMESVAVELKKGSGNTSLYITSSPTNAEVRLGELYGATPLIVPSWTPGDYNITVGKTGYKAQQRVISVEGDIVNKYHFDLKPESKVRTKKSGRVRLGLSASVGFMSYETLVIEERKNRLLMDSVNETGVPVEVALQLRFGNPNKSVLGFVTGVKYQYLFQENSDISRVFFPLTLNINYYSLLGIGLSQGISFEPGFSINNGKKGYCHIFNLKFAGLEFEHHALGLYAKFGGKDTNSNIVSKSVGLGLGYTYYF